MSDERKLGPNMKRLLFAFMARLAVPPGGGFAGAVDVFLNPEKMKENMREALKQADLAIAAMRSAPDNPYGDDEETIAKTIIDEVDKHR